MDIQKRAAIFIILSLVVIGAVLFYFTHQNKKEIILPTNNQSVEDNVIAEQPTQSFEQEDIFAFQSPLNRAGDRVTKKPFGILIDPKTSPVQPERFAGYHTGTDFEIFPEELDIDVTVRAVCSGKVRSRGYINGYGGVVIQDCLLDEKNITVLYGHLKLGSVKNNAGDELNATDAIGTLGAAYSSETSGERKHLHLGFHKGGTISVLGYVQNKNALADWMDPCLYVCK